MRPGLLRLAGLLLAGLLSSAAVSEAPGASLPTVAVDLSRLDDTAYAALDGLALERQIVVRLVQEGFAVVSPAERADIHITVLEDDGHLVLEVKTTAGQSRTRLDPDEAPLAERHLEVAQRVAVLAHANRPRAPNDEAPDDPGEDATPVDGPSRDAPDTSVDEGTGVNEGTGVDTDGRATPFTAGHDRAIGSESADAFPRGIDLAAGVVVRAGGTDPMGHVGFRLSLAPRLVARARAGLVHAPSAAIRAVEGHGLVGAGLVHPVTGSLELEAVVVGGVLAHRYGRIDGDGEASRGLRLDPIVALDLGAALRLSPRIALSARVSPGATLRSREHRRAGEILWTRGRLRAEGVVGIIAEW